MAKRFIFDIADVENLIEAYRVRRGIKTTAGAIREMIRSAAADGRAESGPARAGRLDYEPATPKATTRDGAAADGAVAPAGHALTVGPVRPAFGAMLKGQKR